MARNAPESFWGSLRYFNLYRVTAAAVFFAASVIYRGGLNLGAEAPTLFAAIAGTYVGIALLLFPLTKRARPQFDLLLTAEVAIDIVFLTILMHLSGGVRSGMGYMLLVVLAGAGLVGQGRLTLFYSALATLGVLLEHGYRVLMVAADPAEFVQVGITSIGFFAVAITARLLARRVVANENLARQRGVALAEQLRVSERIIRDMQDGVLVVEADGRVRQFNPRAEQLFDVKAPLAADLGAFSAVLAERYNFWRARQQETVDVIRLPASGNLVQVRYVPAGDGDIALIYIDDMAQVQAHAEQMKLAALGRLTANLAHEIRNPLSAISQAAELLTGEKRGDTIARLTRIIGDNTQRLNRLVAEVLELGRRDRARPETLVVRAFLETFLEEFAIHDPRIRDIVRTRIDPEARACFDRSHMNRVLWNLLVNALRYCSGGAGSVLLEAGRLESAGKCELHIIDDGRGIEPSLRHQVFEPFFTTHGAGTGLGLYIARELCEANGATLEILDNSPGAHFRITARGEPCQEDENAGRRTAGIGS